MFNIETVVYIYIGVCICMILFNFMLIFYRKTQGYRLKKHSKKISQVIAIQLKYIENNGVIKRKIQKQLEKKLTKINYLMAFHEAIIIYLEKNEDLTRKYLLQSRSIFSTLAVKYRHKDSIKRAYFAYLMSQYKVCSKVSEDVIIDTMLEMILGKSAYCRENALKALYSFGNEKKVFQALKLISDNGIFHHEKLITDGLLSFQGDKELLGKLLWQHFEEFNLELQLSIVSFIRFVSENYKEEFYFLLTKKNPNKEIKIAIIRYFWRHFHGPMLRVLKEYIETEKDWEVAAISASALRNYPCKESIHILTKALRNSNWYIRYNAAESLGFMKVEYRELAYIYNGEDRYAREMILYQEQCSKIREDVKLETVR